MARRYVRGAKSTLVERTIIKTKQVKRVLTKRTPVPKGHKWCKVCGCSHDKEDMTQVKGQHFPYWMCMSHMYAGLSGLREA